MRNGVLALILIGLGAFLFGGAFSGGASDPASPVRAAHDYCADATSDSNKAVAHEKAGDHSASYAAAVAGLAANERCDDDDEHIVNEGYLLSDKAFAEHYLPQGDWRTDFNQANALLVECQTRPALYGTHEGAGCETQENYNIRQTTDWEMGE